jgi:hypothetical protein
MWIFLTDIVCQEYLNFILFLKYNELGSDTTLLSVRIIYILFYFLNIMNWDRILLTDNSVVSDPNSLYLRNKIKYKYSWQTIVQCPILIHYTYLLSVRNIYILSYFLNIMNWDRTLHYSLSGIFTFYFIS